MMGSSCVQCCWKTFGCNHRSIIITVVVACLQVHVRVNIIPTHPPTLASHHRAPHALQRHGHFVRGVVCELRRRFPWCHVVTLSRHVT